MTSPTLGYSEFTGSLLGAWFDDQATYAGDAVSSTRDAAAMALYAATVAHAGKRGTVLVVCSGATAARSCLDFLKSFCVDQPTLAAATKKVELDGVTLHGGARIVVTADATRRPAKTLCTVRLDAIEATPPTNRQIARALVDLAVQNPGGAVRAELILGVEPGSLRQLHDRLVVRAIDGYEASRLAARAAVPPPSPPTSVPTVPREPELPEGFFTPEEEEHFASRKMMRGWDDRHAPTVHRRKPQ